MNILKQITKDREGNDCWIYETFAVVKSSDSLFLVHHQKVTGYFENESMNSIMVEDKEDLCNTLHKIFYELNDTEIDYLCEKNWEFE